jgi:DNA-binding NtrC family response regulator
VVEDHGALRDALGIALGAKGYKVVTAKTGDAGVQALETQSFDVVVTDLKLPGKDGLEILATARRTQPRSPAILMTAHGNKDAVVSALRLGAHDFIEKPFDIDEMEARIERALEQGRRNEAVAGLRETAMAPYQPDNIIGESEPLKTALEIARKVAPAPSAVLITGATGTGKELIAGAIHALSPRSGGEFVAVNCAAIPDTLLESELFGHERGAFTGAARRRVGRFERAHHGTLFLDEIGDMSLTTQAKILRVLQDGRLERLGGDETVEVDVRCVAATHRDLVEEVRKGTFREDLFYRLNVVNIHLPSLNERQDDVVLLARHFAAQFCADFKRAPIGFDEGALQALRAHTWPGNVRELRNAVERAVLLCEDPTLGAADLGLGPRAQRAPRSGELQGDSFQFEFPASGVPLKVAERELLLAALHQAQWVQKEAARLLGITKRAIHYKIEQHGITHPSWTKNRPQPDSGPQ